MRKIRNYLITISLVLLSQLAFPANAHQLPDLGNEFRDVISIHDEALIGNVMMCSIRAQGVMHNDLLVQEYVSHLGNRLTPYMQMPYSNLRIKFFALNDNSINAFAFFGGHVAVHSGLITSTENESELAGVMAHELAHISQQHVLRQMSEDKRQMPITIASALASMAIGVPELVLASFAGHAQKMLNFSRQHEQEADRLGLQILSKANFDPQGLPNILERMNLSLRYHNKPPEYLLTHPLFESRIADTRSRANTLRAKQQGSSNMFHLIRARLLVQNADNLQRLLEEYEKALATQRYNNKMAADYTYAYILLQKGQPHKAWDAFSELVSAYPDDLIIQSTAAEILAQQDKFKLALHRTEHLLQIYPDSAAILLQHVNLLLQNKQPKLARKFLQTYKELHTPDPTYYEHVRQTEGIFNNQFAIYEANAEWYALHGDLNSALKQLELADSIPATDQKSKHRIKNRKQELADLLVKIKKL